jgi:hypothetical protein
LQYVPDDAVNNNNNHSSKLQRHLSLNANAPKFTPGTTKSGFVPSFGNGGNILDQLLPEQNRSNIPSGQLMIPSGKFSGPTQPQGKSYFKDEIVIRNADSGKGTVLLLLNRREFYHMGI